MGGTRVGPQAIDEYLGKMQQRYAGADREGKTQLLDEMEEMTGRHRKALIRRLRRSIGAGRWDRRARKKRRRGRPVRYGPRLVSALLAIWKAAGYPWSVRLKALLPAWLPWAARHLALSSETKARLLTMSPRQMDRALRRHKTELRRRQYGRTRPGTLLKHQIPLKTDRWNVDVPGFTEIDLVAHSGASADGEFAHSLNVTDIHTTWVESRAVLGKSQVRVQEALEHVRQALPFALRGIDSDNGSEFINAHLHRYCKTLNVQFTRGRPYKKDDNAHIEQKNWTHVRKLLGYVRYDTPAAVDAINDLFADLRLLQNLFLPSVKLMDKRRVGAKVRRRYDAPRTPFERLQAGGTGDVEKVRALDRLRAHLDPFALAARIDRKLERIYRLANHRMRPASPMRPVDGARPVDAKSAPTRSLEDRQKHGLPHRPPASSSKRSVTRLMAR